MTENIAQDPTAPAEVAKRVGRAVSAYEAKGGRSRRLKQHEIGAMVGMKPDAISALMAGQRKTFTVAEAWLFANTFGCDPCWLAFEIGPAPSERLDAPLRHRITARRDQEGRA